MAAADAAALAADAAATVARHRDDVRAHLGTHARRLACLENHHQARARERDAFAAREQGLMMHIAALHGRITVLEQVMVVMGVRPQPLAPALSGQGALGAATSPQQMTPSPQQRAAADLPVTLGPLDRPLPPVMRDPPTS